MNDLARVELSAEGRVYVARVRGEVDVSNVDEIMAEIGRGVPNTAGAFVLDLTETTYIDSAGIRLLFELGRRLNARRQPGRAVVPDDSLLLRVLRIAQVAETLPLRPTLSGALSELEEIVSRESRAN
jgi:anti-anti-sigma factor